MLSRLIPAGAALVLLVGTAYAQIGGESGGSGGFPMPSITLGKDKPPPTQEEIERQRAIDNAYNSANKKIPEKQGATDPWGNVRANPSSQAKSNPNPSPAKKNTGSSQAKNNPNPPQAKNGQ